MALEGVFRVTYRDVLLVRHGESEANATGRFACRTWDPHLTAKGRAQARQLANQLQHADVRYVITSPLSRARETVAPLADILGITPVIVPDLAEVDLGRWDGHRLKDLEKHDPDLYAAWRRDPEQNPPPGGERITDVGRRVLAALEQFATSHPPGLTVAATHADCLKGAMLVLMNAPGPFVRSILAPNCGQLHLRRTPAGKWLIVLSPLYLALEPEEPFGKS